MNYDPKDDVINILAEWSNIDLTANTTVLSRGIKDILSGDVNSDRARNARYLAACQKINHINRCKIKKNHLPMPSRRDFNDDV